MHLTLDVVFIFVIGILFGVVKRDIEGYVMMAAFLLWGILKLFLHS